MGTDRSLHARYGPRPLLRLLPLWAAGAGLLAVLVTLDGIPSDQLLLDPAAYGGWPWYQGLVSNLGILSWATATAAAGIGARLARAANREPATRLLLGGFLLSILLTVDDLFQLHIVVAGTLGITKPVVYAGYALLLTGWLAGNSQELRRTPLPVLVAAVAALAGSVAFDQGGGSSPARLVAEDACKFLGILAWTLYFVETTVAVGRSLLPVAPVAPPTPLPVAPVAPPTPLPVAPVAPPTPLSAPRSAPSSEQPPQPAPAPGTGAGPPPG